MESIVNKVLAEEAKLLPNELDKQTLLKTKGACKICKEEPSRGRIFCPRLSRELRTEGCNRICGNYRY